MSSVKIEVDDPRRLEPDVGPIIMAACDGLATAALVGRTIFAANAVVPGGPVARRAFPLPDEVDEVEVVSLSPNGMVFIDKRRRAWVWQDSWSGKPAKSRLGHYTLAYRVGDAP